ncbi:MAG: glycosyltransferase family 2 protein [Acidobacteria bacterium]|nr:glycosyltransferase family 2 protein [Acidobacteriota bacterium]
MKSISVIIPVFNGARYIRETVQSVLEQSLKPDEIIIVDDGSTDETPKILANLAKTGIITIRQNNMGPGSARNRGIEASTGSLIAFLDADDLWLPEKLAEQKRILSERPEIAYVLCCLEEFYSAELAKQLVNRTILRPDTQTGVLPTTALFRKSVFQEVGLFNPVWRTGEFMDWMMRANEAGITSYKMEQVLVQRRVHDQNLGRSAAVRGDYHRILKAALDRKRRSNM